MARLYTCPRGHQWEPPVPEETEACPVCGAPGEPLSLAATAVSPPSTLSGTPPWPTLPERTGPEPGEGLPAVPGYTILDVLGRGGMGVVYKALQGGLNRLVALKMILAGEHARPDEQARFRAEAQTAARLQHPHIAQVYEVGEHEGRPFFSLEYVAGGSLAGRLDGTPWPARKAAELVETLSRAVQFAHERGVVHRDLKPANVLLTGDGNPKIADFGLAKRLDPGVSQTPTGAVLGTPKYMAPEQAWGKSKILPVGPAADVYALGAMLYELVTGRAPFVGETPWDVVPQVLTQEPVPPRRLVPKVPRDLETICLKCLQKEPRKRYASADMLAEDLRRFGEGRPILARPVGRVERCWRWCRRNPALAGAGGLALLALAAGVVVALVLRAHFLEKGRADHAAALVSGLRHADIGQVPALIREIEDYRPWADPLLRRENTRAQDGSRVKLYTSLALLPGDGGQVDYLFGQLLRASPTDLVVIRGALRQHRGALAGRLWPILEDGRAAPDRRFRAACALADYDGASQRWPGVAPFVADRLLLAVQQNPSHYDPLLHLLRPVGDWLLGPLGAVFRSGDRPEGDRTWAAIFLGEYAAGRPELLADLLQDGDPRQFAVLFPKAEVQREKVVPALQATVRAELKSRKGAPEKERLAKRQANAAVALLRLGQPDPAWDLLKHGPDPRARSYLIHRLGPLGAEPKDLLQRLGEEKEVSVRRALLLSLGEFSKDQVAPAEREALIPRLLQLYKDDPDPGLHGAVEWLLRTWEQDNVLQEINEDWARDRAQRERRQENIRREVARDPAREHWYVTCQGQTMVVIPKPGAFFWMGSPTTEANRLSDEYLHKMRIGRSFAIAAKPVTVKQFNRYCRERFGTDHRYLERYAPLKECPVPMISWYQAAVYCNWLSKQEGIPPEQWCYEVDARGLVTKLRENYLRLTGYRLPTEAEWEYACRAGAGTSRYYGEGEELLGKYGWYLKNSGSRSHRVGALKPNDLGLFDMHGNLWCWCQERFTNYPKGEEEKVLDDLEGPLTINPQDPRVLRGGSFYLHAEEIRSACRTGNVPAEHFSIIGFRPARTFSAD